VKHEDAIVLYGTVMKILTKNIFQQTTGEVGQMNTAMPQGKENETQKRDFLISYHLAGTCKRYNPTLEGKRDGKGFIGEGGGELNITHGV
jgi:hypothetical protein